MTTLERNKKNVAEFYELGFNKQNINKAIELYMGDQYIQHNPMVADGIEPFREYSLRMDKEFPDKKVIIKKIVAEGDIVIVHVHQIWENPHEEYAIADMFRLDEQGKIVEHWDVMQLFPKTSANDHPMF